MDIFKFLHPKKYFFPSDRPWGLFGPIVWWKKFMLISPLFWNVAYLQQLTLEHFEGKKATLTELRFMHTKYFIKIKGNTIRRTNKQNLSLCILVSPAKWFAASLSLCVMNTWSASHLYEQASLYEISRKSFCSCQGKDMLHTFGKRCVGCFCVEASCITLVSPGRWESDLHYRVTFSFEIILVFCPFSFLQWKLLQPKLMTWCFLCTQLAPP